MNQLKMTLEKLAAQVAGHLEGDPGYRVAGVAPFESASASDVTFASGAKYLKALHKTEAGAIFVPRDYTGDRQNVIRVDNPQ